MSRRKFGKRGEERKMKPHKRRNHLWNPRYLPPYYPDFETIANYSPLQIRFIIFSGESCENRAKKKRILRPERGTVRRILGSASILRYLPCDAVDL